MTFLARPAIAPRSAACAAPSRYHQAGVSPLGRRIAGTSTRRAACGRSEGRLAGRVGPLAQAARVRAQASDSKRRCGFVMPVL